MVARWCPQTTPRGAEEGVCIQIPYGKHRTSNTQHPTSNLEKPDKASQGHPGANAEGRMQNEERPGEATSCDINATSRPVDSQLIATLRPPQCVYKTPTKRLQSLETDHGPRTTDHLRAKDEGGRQKAECSGPNIERRTSNIEHPTPGEGASVRWINRPVACSPRPTGTPPPTRHTKWSSSILRAATCSLGIPLRAASQPFPGAGRRRCCGCCTSW